VSRRAPGFLLVQVEDGISRPWQIQDLSGRPAGVGLFVSRAAAQDYAWHRGWTLSEAPSTSEVMR